MLKIALTFGLSFLIVQPPSHPASESRSLGDQIRSEANINEVEQDERTLEMELSLRSKSNRHEECYVFITPSDRCSGREFFEPPFSPAFFLPGSFPSGVREWVPLFSWVREESVRGGKSVLDPILESAKSRTPLCAEDICEIGVTATDAKHQTEIAGICQIERIGNHYGPPTECEAIALQNKDRWWIKVITSVAAWKGMGQVYRIEIRGLPRSSILSRLNYALALDPFRFPDRVVKVDRLMATGPKRHSEILRGNWFEWPQVFIEIDDRFDVDVSLDLLVNKQNTEDPADWHQPTAQQVEQYRKAIVQTVSNALTSICVRPIWSGTDRLSCDGLRTDDGVIVGLPNEDGKFDKLGGKRDPRVTIRDH